MSKSEERQSASPTWGVRARSHVDSAMQQCSTSFKQERTLILDRDRTVIDLCVELLGSLVDLDFFIASNDLSGSEMIELQRGQTIVYYL